MSDTNCWLFIFCIIYLGSICVTAYNPNPRWGQATVVINNALYIYGGKSDLFNAYGYSAAPVNNDLLYLPLSKPFDTSSPPWRLLTNSSNPEGPALAWHTLSAFNTSHILMFGGLPGPNSQTVLFDLADSSLFLNVLNQLEPIWISEVVSWANQPVRRVHHSSTTASTGNIYVIGGEKADGSNNPISEHYIFKPDVPSFTVLPNYNGPPDIVGHVSVILPDGRLLVFGGYSQSQGLMFPLSTVWSLDTTRDPPSWSLLSVSDSSLPAPRRAFAAVSLGNGNVLIHGGSDAVLQNSFSDGWILNTSRSPMVWSYVEALSQLGARRDHFAISSGDQVIFDFGYGGNLAAPSSLLVYDHVRNNFLSTYTPPSTSPVPTIPGSSPTSSSGGSLGTSAEIPSRTSPPNDNGTRNQGATNSSKKTAIAVGITFGILGLLTSLLVAYYVRRRRLEAQGKGRFIVLPGGDEDGRSSPHFGGEIPIAMLSRGTRYFNNRRGWNVGVLNTLPSLVTASTKVRTAPERRDMLADEDTREFGEWHDEGRLNRASGSSWSVKSILGPREPGISGITGIWSRREKSDPFADSVKPLKDKGIDHTATTSTVGRRHLNYSSSQSYSDPFADLIEEEEEDRRINSDQVLRPPYLHPLPQPPTTIQTALPSQGGLALDIISERSSQTTPPAYERPNPASSLATFSNSPSDSSLSQLTSLSSVPSPNTPGPLMSSIVDANSPPNQFIPRTDSWWTRFSRTNFLDRRLSNASRVSGGMSEFRDPNPPPRLIATDENLYSTPIGPNSADWYLPKHAPPLLRTLPAVYENPNKSMTSVGTADTETIERMAKTVDVQIRSQRTPSASTTTSSHSDSRHSYRIQGQPKRPGVGEFDYLELPDVQSPIDGDTANLPHIPISPSTLPVPSSSIKLGSPAASGAVSAHIQEIERLLSKDRPALRVMDVEQREGRDKRPGDSMSVSYGLIQRANLFVANPGHSRILSNDS